MTLLALLRLRWRRQWRNGGTQLFLRGVAWGLFATYVGLFVGWIGLVFPETVAESGAQRAPTRVLNQHLLSVSAGLLVVRFVLQRFVDDEWRALFALPVRRSTIARALQGEAAVSLLNLLSLLGVATLAWSTIAPSAPPTGTAFWTAGTLLMVATTQFIHVGLRVAWAYRNWGIVLGIGAAVLGLVGLDVYGVVVLRDVSAWLFGGAQRGHGSPLLILLATTVGTAVASTAALQRYTYDWIEGTSQSGWTRPLSYNVRGWEQLSSLVVLEGKLIFRNRGPREQLFAGIAALAFVVYMIAGAPLPVFSLGMAPFMLGLLLPIAYGQFAFAWHGKHFDGLLAHVAPEKLVRAAVVVVLMLAVGPLLLTASMVAWTLPLSAVAMLAFSLYHAGITVPTVVGTGLLWNRNWVNPEQSRFTFSGGSIRGMVLMMFLSVPPALFGFLGDISTVLVGVAGLGGVGLATVSLWLPRLEASLRRRRYAMLRGFRGRWLSPHEWHW